MRIDVDDDNDDERGPLRPHGMGPINIIIIISVAVWRRYLVGVDGRRDEVESALH